MHQGNVVRSLRKNWWMVLLSVLLCTGIAAAVTAATVPVYQSSVRFYVFAPTATGQTALQADELARLRIVGYASLLTSEKIVEQITKASGVDQPVETVVDMIRANGDADTLILTADVRSADQDDASAIASAIATNFNRLVNELEESGSPDAETVLNVVAGPTRDDNPVSPNEALNYGLGFLVGLALGLGLVIARSRADRSLRSIEDLEAVSGLKLLATVPAVRSVGGGTSGVAIRNSLQFEALRNLRTNLRFRSDADSPRVITVTSTSVGGGASTIAYNLAVACAEADYRTLLIEADLRNPQLSRRAGTEHEGGLSGILQHGADFGTVVAPGPHEGLWILGAGTPSGRASELLSGAAMQAVLATAKDSFDLVILDAAPLLPFSDSRTICALSDGVIVVARYGHSDPGGVRAAVETLDLVGANVLGVVFNGVPVPGRLGKDLSPEAVHGDRATSGARVVPVAQPEHGEKRGQHVERR